MRRLFLGAVVLALLVVFVQPVRAQTPTPPVFVRQLLSSMTPEERVGQLFLVTFTGTDAGETSQIYDLIVNHHVGGVVLLAGNDNFVAAPNTLTDAHRLIASLQETERFSSTVQVMNAETGRLGSPAYVPLWVGIAQEGNGAPTDQVINGLTSLPSEMALGATWQPELAEQVGAVAGGELSALGFNLYFGPSLDVLEQTASTSSGDLGTRVFGGDPFWVGEMGRAYIRGLHSGSDNRLLVIARHFPGRGSSDRLPEEEVATVRKSLEQLKQIELAPFFAVTGNAPDLSATADGLLVSHIRYQGFQGNIRATTRPVSFDSQALTEILKLPQFLSWWENGGLIVSDDLGSRAVRDFYAPGGGIFNARSVARDAFLAGNDLMYLGNITSDEAPDNYGTVVRILDFFAQKYSEDPAFALRVDAAVTRILMRKFGLYGAFPSAEITPDAGRLDLAGTSNQVAFQVASNAVSLLSPERLELDSILPSPPTSADYIVFLTDSSSTRQCSTCLEQATLATDALQQAISRLYGPAAGGQIISSHLASYSFQDLSNMLDGTTNETIEPYLRRADWVIISLADASSGQPQLLRQFLSERQDLLRAKKVILFSFGAPYYLDSTDISKFSAYFGLYSKSSAFVEVAARVLYQELPLDGHSPVSIPGIGYDLIFITAPDPGQIISLTLDLPADPAATAISSLTPEPTAMPSFNMGDTVTVRTGTIIDQNGNPVPDGTVVRFTITLGGEGGGVLQQQDATTTGGVASTSYRLEKPGLVDIRAASEPATISEVLQLDVTEGAAAVVTVIVPVLSETVVPMPSTPVPVEESDFVTTEGAPRFGGWMLILFVLGGGTLLAYWVGGSIASARWSMRWALCVLLGGLVVYNYLALSLPGAADVLKAGGSGTLVGLTVLGELIGALCAWLWMRRRVR
jgi:beta-N-acetylhexosaminidase